jgi:NADH-dependent peroxiredoxin subunit F
MIYDLIIIGAGPAGITASIYAARKMLNFMVISKDVGGQVVITSKVDNYTGYQEISGAELVKKFDEHLKQFKFDFKMNEVQKIEKINGNFLIKANNQDFQSKTLIIATGAKPKMLKAKGEVEFKNRGVTYCATCDAPLFSGRDVAVIGSGNSALDAVLQLINIANKIYLLVRGDSLKGDRVMIEKVKANPKVDILYNSIVTEIIGEKLVKSLKINKNDSVSQIEVQGVFIEIGYIPNTEFLKDFVQVNAEGEIIVDSNNRTNIPGVFAAGDCTDVSYKQIIIAAGEGSKAAISVFDYLSKT